MMRVEDADLVPGMLGGLLLFFSVFYLAIAWYRFR